MTVDDVEQILGWKTRRGQERLGTELYYELEGIQRLWAEKGETASEFADFVPIRIVTIIEVFIREVIRELVDHGQPYVDRAERLTKGTRIDFVFASHVHSRKLSIGDIVAHSISINNPTQIISYFSILIPDFTQKLKVSHSRWSEDKESWPLPPIISDYDDTIARLARLFEIRHIVAHELPRRRMYETLEIDGLLAAAIEFLGSTDWVIVQSTRGELRRTQSAMNSHAGGELHDLDEEMIALMARLRERDDLNREVLLESQRAWEIFAEREADLHASLVEGGSMYPMIWASAKADVTRERIKALKWFEERGEGDV